MRKLLLLSTLLFSSFIMIDSEIKKESSVKYMYSDNFGSYFVKENELNENEIIFVSNEYSKINNEFKFNKEYIFKYYNSKLIIVEK